MGDSDSSEKMTPPSLPSRLIVIFGAALVAWFIIREAGLALLTASSPQLALSLVPASPSAVIAEAAEGLSLAKTPGPDILAKLSGAMRNAPLASEPFFSAALHSRAIGQSAKATRQMREASRRDPRLVAAHLFLIEQSLRTGAVPEAMARIAIALRLPSDEGTDSHLMQALYLSARDARAGGTLNRILAANPPWRSTFVQYVASQSGDPNVLFTALRPASGKSPEQARVEEQRGFLNGLIAQRDYERAYLAWVNFLPGKTLGEISSVYDGAFRKMPGPPPFNWELFPGESATAEMIDDSRVPPGTALAVNFFGGSRTRIAEQMLFLPPGSYALTIAAVGNSESALGGGFAWEISCLPARSPIARLEFGGLSQTPIARRTSVAIPAECKAQTLTLFGVPGETNAQVSAEFGAISLKPRR